VSERSLLPHHRELLKASAISPAVAGERGYWSATAKAQLEELGFGRKAQRVPSLVIPVRGVTGELEWCAHRPDEPRIADGTPRKYEIPFGASQILDVPAQIRPMLRDPKVPLIELLAPAISERERNQLVEVARLVARGRAGVYRERGEFMGASEPEIPTRLAQQLERLLAGMRAIGVARSAAWKAMLVTAFSCIPGDRRRALEFLEEHGVSTTSSIGVGLQRPTRSIRRTLEDLAAHELTRRIKGDPGKADSWELRKETSSVFAKLPERVLRDVTPHVPPGDRWQAPPDDRATNPQGDTEPRRHAENEPDEWLAGDGVWRSLEQEPPAFPGEILQTRYGRP
jgi:hypothetical protein